MDLTVLRAQLASVPGRMGDAVARSGSVRFVRTPSANAVYTGTTAVPIERLSAADVPVLAESGVTIGGTPVLVPAGAVPGPGPLQSNAGLPAGAVSLAGGNDVLNFTTAPTFGTGVTSDLVNKGISAGIDILTARLGRGSGAISPTISAANPSVADAGIELGKLLKGIGSTTTPTVPLNVQNRLIGGQVKLTKSGKPRRLKKNGMPYKAPSMNVSNVHALRRSARRLEGFEKLAKRVVSLTHRVHVKKSRRRR